jgi:hypothetical protein
MKRLILGLSCSIWLFACSGGENNNDDGGTTTDAGTDTDAGVVDQCASFATEHEQFLNAPTHSTIVQKTPAQLAFLPDGGLP